MGSPPHARVSSRPSGTAPTAAATPEWFRESTAKQRQHTRPGTARAARGAVRAARGAVRAARGAVRATRHRSHRCESAPTPLATMAGRVQIIASPSGNGLCGADPPQCERRTSRRSAPRRVRTRHSLHRPSSRARPVSMIRTPQSPQEPRGGPSGTCCCTAAGAGLAITPSNSHTARCPDRAGRVPCSGHRPWTMRCSRCRAAALSWTTPAQISHASPVRQIIPAPQSW